ncbi:nuclear transport factor 2 family protein [Parahaliea mediterranea]|uniref:Nuclear transport factor 2 family protein n=1 Tax=Parahaliea mediterranea TaxID=651086 RepID=A0A939DE15_9GAMM|nr:nuclear transport factor 2 family protein [Parahaliea mediterranea]MBN7796166.1 nuclear transport factor 2 family protein [Parahaliea mediterranea]
MAEQRSVEDIIELYVRGTYEGCAEDLCRCFHDSAVMNGYLVGELMMTSPRPFIEEVSNFPVKNSGCEYRHEILHTHIEGNVAAVTLRESGYPGGMCFTNLFHLIDDGSGWKIISKTFTGGYEP